MGTAIDGKMQSSDGVRQEERSVDQMQTKGSRRRGLLPATRKASNGGRPDPQEATLTEDETAYKAAIKDLEQALREEMYARCLHEACESRVEKTRNIVNDLFARAVSNGERS